MSILYPVSCILYLVSSSFADSGQTGAVLMQETFGARAKAMGEAYVALSDDPYGLVFNVSAISQVRRKQITTSYTQSLLDTNYQMIAYAQPWGAKRSLGAGIATLDGGSIEIFRSNGTVETRPLQRDFLVTLGYSQFYPLHWKKPWDGRIHWGLGLKYYNSTLIQEMRANSYALDLGVLWENGTSSLGLGTSNLGPAIGYQGGFSTGVKDPLPSTWRAGIARKFMTPWRDGITASMEGKQILGEKIKWGLGIEYRIKNLLAIRGGYRLGESLSSLTMGMGILQSNIHLDYAFGLMSAINSTHQVSLSFEFGPLRPAYALPVRTKRRSRTPAAELKPETQKETVSKTRVPEYVLGPQELEARGLYFQATEMTLEWLKLQDQPAVDAQRLKRIDQKMREWESQGQNANPVRFFYAKAYLAYFSEKDFLKTVAELEKLLREDPNHPEAQLYLRKVKQHSFERYSQIQKRILKLYQEALELMKQNKMPQAAEIARNILKTDPEHAGSLAILSKTKKMKPLKPAARNKSSTRARTAPDGGQESKLDKLYNEGLQAYLKGNMGLAGKLLRQALAVNPNNQKVRKALERVLAER